MEAIASAPILSCAETKAWEKKFLADEAAEWAAMQRAGEAVGVAVLNDFLEIGGFPADGRILVLAGKGHNGGDALLAAKFILEKNPRASAEILFVFGERTLRPLARRAWQALVQAAAKRLKMVSEWNGLYDLCLDGIFGFQFRPPLQAATKKIIKGLNASADIQLRAAVDLPSGVGAAVDKVSFRADFTYATGVLKAPLLAAPTAGRLRYLDLGFFVRSSKADARDRVLTSEILSPLARLRPPRSDKRSYGHLLVVAGSLRLPGAALMAVLGALRSGVGLVTAFVPEPLVAEFAARAPEAMWVGCPTNRSGGLARAALALLREKFSRAAALLIGSGFGRDEETLNLAAEIAKISPLPLVIDGDALQKEVVRAGQASRVLTPHAGEFKRIAGSADLRAFGRKTGAVIALKGPGTRICGDGRTVYHSFFGGPSLARGGSGDVLAGLIGGLLAQAPAEPLLAACRGVVWHGLAADLLARSHGQVTVRTTQLCDFLDAALREV